MQQTVDRRSVSRGGLVGLLVGVGLLALSLFLLVSLEEPEELLGVFLTLAVSMVSLALATMALVPLRFGDSSERSPRVVALCFRALAALGVVITAVGAARGALPWTAFGLLPLLAAAALVKDSFRVACLAEGPAGGVSRP